MPPPGGLGADSEAVIDTGTAGASARREHERLRESRERRIREAHPRIGGAILALSDEPQDHQAWDRGAGGEERVADSLAKRLSAAAVVLHDRRIPRSRANIDHIAVAPSGVWVIDTKRYKGKVAVSKPLFGEPKLIIAGRNRTKLVDGLDRQVQLVRQAVDEHGCEVPVTGALCFVDAELPVLRTLTIRGHVLVYSKALAKRINARGQGTAADSRALASALALRFPPA